MYAEFARFTDRWCEEAELIARDDGSCKRKGKFHLLQTNPYPTRLDHVRHHSAQHVHFQPTKSFVPFQSRSQVHLQPTPNLYFLSFKRLCTAMSQADHSRDPWQVIVSSLEHLLTCSTQNSPWVILNDFGGAFSMGAVGGGIWYGIKGARNSPRVSTPHPRPTWC